MQKLIILVLLASFVPSEVFSDGKLQVMTDILKTMNTSRLCEHDCRPEVKINGTKLTVTFLTAITDGVDTNALCKCMNDYMQEAVGNATSDCLVTSKQFAILFHGEYNPNKASLPPLTTLSRIISNYEEPDLGGYKCSREISEQGGRIYITLTHTGKEYKSACAGILRYLNQNNFLGGVSSQCKEIDSDEKAVLDLWVV